MRLNNLFKHWTYSVIAPGTLLREKYEAFKDLLARDHEAHELMAELEEVYYGRKPCGFSRVERLTEKLCQAVGCMVNDLEIMSPAEYASLKDYFRKIDFYIKFLKAPPDYNFSPPFTLSRRQLLEETDPDPEAIGGKALGLSVIAGELALPCPEFFVITTNAFYYFLEFNGLTGPISDHLAKIDITSPASLEKHSEAIIDLIRSSELPPDVTDAIMENMNAETFRDIKYWSVRSSAVGEDSDTSFAGQYESILNVPKDKIAQACLEVISSKYSPSAICYRIMHGFIDLETPMAVVVQQMIEPEAAGIVYSRRPDGEDLIEINAVWGLGEAAVSGVLTPDRFLLKRTPPFEIVEKNCGEKPFQLLRSPSCPGTRKLELPEAKKRALSIDESSATLLAKWVMNAENYFGKPQDMEWCISGDSSRTLYCLQTRPLATARKSVDLAPEREMPAEVLASGTVTASGGAACGPVFIARSSRSLSGMPAGSVLVARSVPPSYVAAFGTVAAIVSEEAVTASHAATVAREAGIPFLGGVEQARSILEDGMNVTVDADAKRIYKGIYETLAEQAKKSGKSDTLAGSPMMRKLKGIVGFILPLNLINHKSPDFRPESCRTMHDIIRFCHEKAMQNMFSLGDKKRGSARGAKHLATSIPLSIYVLDVGGGIDEQSISEASITMDDVVSVPMLKVWEGLSDSCIKWDQGEHFDWGEYDNVVLGGGIINKDSPSLASYAILSGEYMNLSMRFGYHFVIIDALASANSATNYITFRFSGGGGDDEGRFLRAEFLKNVLERLDFDVKVKGELVDAEFRHGDRNNILSRLPTLGRLLGATRLMDMRLDKNSDIPGLANQFMEGRCDFVSEE